MSARVCLKVCDKERVCDILGQCVYEHDIVQYLPDGYMGLRVAKTVAQVVKIFERFSPKKLSLPNRRTDRFSENKVRVMEKMIAAIPSKNKIYVVHNINSATGQNHFRRNAASNSAPPPDGYIDDGSPLISFHTE